MKTWDNGQSFAELTYDAWGMPESPNKLLNNDHGNYVYATYTGHIFDTTLDIYFAEARFYDAQTRQWLAMDPIKSGNNWYQYCYSSPIIYFDPDGQVVQEILKLVWEYAGKGAVIGGLIGAGTELNDQLKANYPEIDTTKVLEQGGRYAVDGAIINASLKLDFANAGAGIASQAVADVIPVIRGEGLSSPEAYAGAAFGGFVTGKVGSYAGSAAGTLTTDLLENTIGEENHTNEEILGDLVGSAITTKLTGHFAPGRALYYGSVRLDPKLSETIIEGSITEGYDLAEKFVEEIIKTVDGAFSKFLGS